MDTPSPLPAPQSTPAPAAAAAEPVGFWVRAGAAFIDAILSWIVTFFIGLALRLAGLPGLLVGVIQFSISAAYYAAFVGEWGATVGKMAAGAVIVRVDGGPVGYGRAIGRFFAQYLSLFVLGLGYVMAAFTENKRALHDYVYATRAWSTGRT